jgi:hypothetical protein
MLVISDTHLVEIEKFGLAQEPVDLITDDPAERADRASH